MEMHKSWKEQRRNFFTNTISGVGEISPLPRCLCRSWPENGLSLENVLMVFFVGVSLKNVRLFCIVGLKGVFALKMRLWSFLLD